VRVVGVIYVRDELCSLIISNEQFHSVEGFIAKNNLLCIIELFSFDFLDPSPYTGFASKIIESTLFYFFCRALSFRSRM
jgi:hypothetical protein